MKLPEIKQEIYRLTCTNNTKQLKNEHPQLVEGKDLRYKVQWLTILDEIKLLRNQNLDISLTDLEDSEKMLKESLFTIGNLAGLNHETIELDWQKIKLENQFSDLHIEEL